MASQLSWRARRALRLELVQIEEKCWYCGFDLKSNPWASTLDHVVATSAGGTDHRENLRLACCRCNRRKSNYPMEWVLFHVNGHLMYWHERAAALRKLGRRCREPIHAADTPAR